MNRLLLFCVGLLIIMPTVLFSWQPASLHNLSHQCIEIWRMMSDLVEKNSYSATEITEPHNVLDQILCGLVKIRDTISQLKNDHEQHDTIIEYVESSLDCIESYSYDLIQHYPGSWSTVIQDQVFRTQQEYAQYVMPIVTK